MSGQKLGLESARVMEAANLLLTKIGRRQQLVSCTGSYENAFQFKSATGKTIIVPCYRRNGCLLGIRSVLQRVNERQRFSWLINGQADRNMQELAFFGETAIIQFSRDEVVSLQYDQAVAFKIPQPMEDAERRTAVIEADENPPPFPEITNLVIRDMRDHPVEFPLKTISRAA